MFDPEIAIMVRSFGVLAAKWLTSKRLVSRPIVWGGGVHYVFRRLQRESTNAESIDGPISRCARRS